VQLLERDHGIASIEAEARVDAAERNVQPSQRFVQGEDARAGRADAELRVEDDLAQSKPARRIVRRCRRGERDSVLGHAARTEADSGAAGVVALGNEAAAASDLDSNWTHSRRPNT